MRPLHLDFRAWLGRLSGPSGLSRYARSTREKKIGFLKSKRGWVHLPVQLLLGYTWEMALIPPSPNVCLSFLEVFFLPPGLSSLALSGPPQPLAVPNSSIRKCIEENGTPTEQSAELP